MNHHQIFCVHNISERPGTAGALVPGTEYKGSRDVILKIMGSGILFYKIIKCFVVALYEVEVQI